jgi:uncharacterized protein involved in copper resistance
MLRRQFCFFTLAAAALPIAAAFPKSARAQVPDDERRWEHHRERCEHLEHEEHEVRERLEQERDHEEREHMEHRLHEIHEERERECRRDRD